MSATPKSTKLIALGVCLVLCFFLFPVVAYVACYFLPREYPSRVTIEVKTANANDTVGFHSYPDPSQIFLSKTILYPVIDELGLQNKWSAGLPEKLSKEEAYNKLLKMVHKIKEVQNTDMIVLEVGSADKQEAADIANTIAAIYVKIRREDQDAIMTQGLSELKGDVDKQRQKVKDAEDEVTRIRLRDNITDPLPGGHRRSRERHGIHRIGAQSHRRRIEAE